MSSSLHSITALPEGFKSVFSGISLVISTKGFRRYLIVPFLLNIIILAAGIYLAIFHIYPSLFSLIPDMDNIFITILRFAAKPVFVCVVIVITAFMYSFTGIIMCAPFLDMVSEKTELLCTGKINNPRTSVARIIRSILVTLRNTVGLLAFILVFNVILLFFNFIPVIGTIFYSVISFLSVMLFLGYQFYDVNVERHQLPFSKKFDIMWRYKWPCIGIGMAFLVLSYIPIAGFLSTIASTVGATMIFCKSEKAL
jgi:CysZ protein